MLAVPVISWQSWRLIAFFRAVSTVLHFWLISYQTTEENLRHVNTFNSKEEKYLYETSSKIPKNLKIRRIKMTHFKYTEEQEKGSIKIITDSEILVSNDA